MKRTTTALMCALMAGPALAVDRWEVRGDNDFGTNNEMQPGIVQEGHDLQTTTAGPDVDVFKVVTQGERSYEARVFGGGVVWRYPACRTCATFDRVASDGTVLTAGDADLGLGPAAQSVRWIGGSFVEFLRVTPGADGVAGNENEKYDIIVMDTTLYLPRFNNTGAQRTTVILQNTRSRDVAGQMVFHEGNGAVRHSQPFSIAPYATLVLDTASLPALAGRAGSAVIAHTGGQGALTGKGVALEPSTGFTFDTPIALAPR